MGKYLLQASYNAEGVRGLIKEGAAARVAYVTEFVASFGGTVESFHFAMGKHDALVVVDAPDDSVVIAASMAVGASGAVTLSTVKLITAEEADAAIARVGAYRAPGA